MILAYAVLIGLASYRLWRIPAEDSITSWFRGWLYSQSDTSGDPKYARRERIAAWFGDLVSCVWCLGWWISGALAALVAWHEDYSLIGFALLWCAGSTIAGLTRKAVDA